MEWINVKDKLPDPFISVLAIDNVNYFYVTYVNRDNEWLEENGTPIKDVVFWMKLPELPKEVPGW